MRLSELEPKWIHPNVFVFKCPHCQKDILTCKNVKMSAQEQFDFYEKTFGDDWNLLVVPADENCAWSISGNDFNTMSVTPSLDASKSGHWHGWITNGNIQ